MHTYLHLHKENTQNTPSMFRGKYELRRVDYELSRSIDHKGEIVSDVRGGQIRVVIDGFGDELLFAWLFDSSRLEDGEIVTMDTSEKSIEKYSFYKARAIKYRLHFDSNLKDPVSVLFTIEAREITTDNDLYYERR